MQGLVFDHLGGRADYLVVSTPEGLPWHFPFLEADDEELGWPEEGPGSVGKVAVVCIRDSKGAKQLSTDNSQHAVRLVPFQGMLDVHGRLGLNGEADETENQKTSGVRIS